MTILALLGALITKSFEVSVWNTEPLPQLVSDNLGSHLFHLRKSHATQLVLTEMNYSSRSDISNNDDLKKFFQVVSQKQKQLEEQNWRPPTPSTDELIKHADSALESFNKAISLNKENGLYYLGYASLLEQYVDFLKDIKSTVLTTQFQKIILEKAKHTYYKAYELSIQQDLKRKYVMVGSKDIVSCEAGNAYIRLRKAEGSISKDDKKLIAKIEKNLKKIDGLPKAITPIVFSLKPHNSMSDLLAPETKVGFDLDGDGIIEKWPWVNPDTGILVWDPDGKGNITSGRQMFGSISWWLLFTDGYHAMDALDDNRDQSLSGRELIGISVWFDKNSNGISDPGEVTPAKDLGIAKLSTKSSGTENGCPANPKGLTLTDGSILPTYDWIATSD